MNKSHKFKTLAWDYFKTILLSLLAALIIKSSVVGAYEIPSGSMVPTLRIGDRILTDMCAYDLRLPWTDLILAPWRQVERGQVPRPSGAVMARLAGPLGLEGWGRAEEERRDLADLGLNRPAVRALLKMARELSDEHLELLAAQARVMRDRNRKDAAARDK